MNLYVMMQPDAPGNPADTERPLSDLGRKQAADVAAFMVRQVGRVDIVLTSHFQCCIEAGEIIAKALGSYVATTTGLGPDASDARPEISRLAQQSGDVLVIAHDSRLVIGLAILAPGAVAMLDSDSVLRWLVTPQIVERDEDEEAILEAARRFAGLVETPMLAHHYEMEPFKRAVLGDGGKSGNCDDCIDNSDQGWIPADDEFQSGHDEPPFHSNCTCSMETKDRRVRVYDEDAEDDEDEE